MKSNYKKLGQYIREVNIRNKDLQVDLLLGISIQKRFIPSIANTVGTNMTTYKIVKRNQFAYGTVTSRNGDKISIALLEDNDSAIVSQAYKVFEVIDDNELLPEYLMMWFRRPEFDRYARFMSHGSTREVFDWNEMCDVELPVPDITKQQEIVDEYNAIKNRISLNNNLIEKLEDTAQTIYKQWFVDFEFPNEEGKPYKSSGGEMEYCEELEKDIPKVWTNQTLDKLFDIQGGNQPPASEFIFNLKEGYIRFIQIRDYGSDDNITYIPIANKNKICNKYDILIARYGASLGRICSGIDGAYNVALVKVIPVKESFREFLRVYLNTNDFQESLMGIGAGKSAREGFSKEELFKIRVVIPKNNTIIFDKYEKYAFQIYNKTQIIKNENKKLQNLIHIILSKIATID